MKMWHEARKQERKIRGMLVDYRKRAERRQDFYEKIKADPTQFMQIHGRKCKIHLDPAVAAAGDGSAIIVPWQGQQDNLIDRFDVRAHLDHIPLVPKAKDLEDIGPDERQCNYERYRILAQNDFLSIPEDKFLHQLYLEEQFGANAQLENERAASKKKTATGAAIGYTYDDTDGATPFSHILSLPNTVAAQQTEAEGESDSEVDMDVSIEISKLDTSQAHELNACGRIYGMKSNDFYSFLTKDADEADALRMAREEEQEKIMLSGRKSRRERRAQRERRFAGRPLSPPSYAAKEDPSTNNKVNENESDSRSPSPENSGKITYITSFGGEDELQPHSKISINLSKPQASGNVIGSKSLTNTVSYADKVKENLLKLKEINETNRKSSSPRKPMQYLCSRSFSRSRSCSRSRYRRRDSRSRTRGYKSRRSRRRISSSSYSRHRRSRSKSYDRRRSRSRSKSRFRHRSSSTNSSSSSSVQYNRSSSKNVIDTPKVTLVTLSNPRPKSNSPVPPQTVWNNARASKSPIKMPLASPNLSILEENVPTKQMTNAEKTVKDPPEVPIKRYYGRKRDTRSSSSDELVNYNADEPMETSTSDQSNPCPTKSSSSSQNVGGQFGKPSTSTTATSHSSYSEIKISSAGGKQNLRDRLKRKMQMLLNKQYKADKKAEIERTERQIQQQQEREDEMRELALKLRRRQRELRHKYGTPTSTPSKSSKSSDSEHGESDIIEKIVEKSHSKSPSRSRSRDFKRRDRERSNRSRSNTSRTERRSRSAHRSRSCRSFSRRHSRERDYSRSYDHDRDSRRNHDDRNDRYSRDNRCRDSSRIRDYNRYSDRNRDRKSRSIDRRVRHRYNDHESKDRVRDRKDHSPKLQRRLVDY